MFALEKLPYATDALEPYISKRTIEFHYLKHHQGYVNKLNELIVGTGFENLPLEEIIELSRNKSEFVDIYNNAGQVWNHNLYWKSLSPDGGKLTDEHWRKRIERDFGSYENFRLLMQTKAVSQFGSGWVWLAEDLQGNLLVYSTSNADNPLIHHHRALLTIDVWEHGYYLDYQNVRAEYVKNVLDNLLNWNAVL